MKRRYYDLYKDGIIVETIYGYEQDIQEYIKKKNEKGCVLKEISEQEYVIRETKKE